MSPLTLSLRPEVKTRVDMSGITPDRLQDLTQAAIRKIKLQAGTDNLPLDRLFTLQGQAKSAHIVIRAGRRGLLDHVGRDMQSGLLTVQGKAGDFVGHGQRGGELLVTGAAGNWAGRDMRGGQLEVRGDAGDYLAAAFPGDQYGMRDGLILVHGNAGHRAGERMRRGVVVIEGEAGDYCGARLRAGTLIVQGNIGQFAGTHMKRGTIVLAQQPDHLPATFNDCGVYKPVFLALLYRKLADKQQRLRDMKNWPLHVRRMAGDLAVDGKGEILILQDQ